MEHLSSFAISIAAGIALDIYNKSQKTVKKELKKAFEEALKLWCVHENIRNQKRQEFKTELEKYISEPELIENLKNQNSELYSFFGSYEEALANYTSAYNYIKEIRDIERFKKEITILSSIEDTVEDTNKKLTNLIENRFTNNDKILEQEWKRQISIYKESISSFKPKTAINLLVKLEESLFLYGIKPENALLSSIEFLKGECYELIGEAREMYKCYIKANNLNSSNIQIKEKACYSYSKTNEKEKSNTLISEILEYNELSSVAWAVKIINDEGKNLEQLISKTPKLVSEDWNFKRLVYFNLPRDFDFESQIKILEKYDFLSEKYLEEPITSANFKKALFTIEVALSHLIRGQYFEFSRNIVSNLDEFKDINRILGHFLQQMSKTEIFENFNNIQFHFFYSEFVLHKKEEYVLKMQSLYHKIKKHDALELMILANSLQLIGNIDDAISIINEQVKKHIQTLHLEAFCYLKKSDISSYTRISKELLSQYAKIELHSLESLITIPLFLDQSGSIDNVELSDFIDNKEYESEDLKILISAFIRILKNQSDKNDIVALQTIEDKILNKNSNIRFYIPYSYFKLEKWELAISAFKRYVSTEEESRDLFYYILALDKSLSRNQELLELLELWRKEFSFNEELLRIEADLCLRLPDWNRCLAISEHYLEKRSTDESFLVLKLISLNELDIENKDKLIATLAQTFKDYNFRLHKHIQKVCKILIENHLYQIALDILYKKAQSSANIQARTDYLFATTQMPEGVINEKGIVEIGSFVKYKLDDKVQFIEIEEGNELAKKLISKKTGETVLIERPMVKTLDSVLILRVMDKYLCLHDEILEDISSNPYSGFPMQSFEFKDNSPEGISKTFVELFGSDGTFQKEQDDSFIKKYYDFNLSFTELIIHVYQSGYLSGYFNLISFRDGITQIPLMYYPKNINIEDSELVIDFSSLMILYQISREHNVEYKDKFIISKGVVEYIRSFLKKVKSEPKEQLSLSITLDGVKPNFISQEASSSNIIFLERLLDWINLNCIEKVITSKLDIIRKLENKMKYDTFMNIIIENVSLVLEKENRVMLTDDSIYFQFYPIKSRKTISSEFYIKSILSNSKITSIEFLKNRYVGHTYNSDILIEEYNKKLNGLANNFIHCISNTSLRLIPSENTIQTIVDFLKQVAINPLITEAKFKYDATNVMVNLLKGQRKLEAFQKTETLLRKEFDLLGMKLELVLESYKNALLILGRS